MFKRIMKNFVTLAVIALVITFFLMLVITGPDSMSSEGLKIMSYMWGYIFCIISLVFAIYMKLSKKYIYPDIFATVLIGVFVYSIMSMFI